MVYHLGLLKNYHNQKRVILQARRDVDFLDCELWQYLGVRETTKAKLYHNRAKILEWINQTNDTHFEIITID